MKGTLAWAAAALLGAASAMAQAPRYVQVAAGADFKCGLTAQGAVRCAGRNRSGSLGDGGTLDREAADYVSGLTSGARFISAGQTRACAGLTNGTLRCWGYVTGSISRYIPVAQREPAEVPGLDGVEAAAGGGGHFCALRAPGGSVWCWGGNWSGQLGDGTRVDRDRPVPVSGLSGVVALAAGGDHTCAVTVSGAVKCWGSNAYYSLGNGTYLDALTPVEVTGLGRAVAIGVGPFGACAVNDQGRLYCWGVTYHARDSQGRMDWRTSSRPELIAGVEAVTQVSHGLEHVCVRTTLGGAKCFGYRAAPGERAPMEFADMRIVDVASISSYWDQACAQLTTGEIKCWGLGRAPVAMTEAPAPAANLNAQGLFWSRYTPGWGLNVAQQGELLFATLFVFDADREPMWLVMPRGERVAPGRYAGALYRTTGPAFSAAAWNPANVRADEVGRATLKFSSGDSGVFSYSYRDIQESVSIERQSFALPWPACATSLAPGKRASYQDLWWASPAGSESGWGLNIAQQGDVVFATWFTYDPSGRGIWLVAPDARRTGGESWSGTLYRATGTPFGETWSPSDRSTRAVGTATFAFADASHGAFSYSVDGVSGSKPIVRQVFAAPTTICAF